MQRRPARNKTAPGFGVVLAINEAHILAHGNVAVKPRGAERIGVRGEHARGEYDNVHEGWCIGAAAHSSQDGVNAGVGVIVGDRVHGTKSQEWVFVREVVAMPGHDIVGRMGERTRVELGLSFDNQSRWDGVVAFSVAAPSCRVQKIPWVGETIRADGTEFREL